MAAASGHGLELANGGDATQVKRRRPCHCSPYGCGSWVLSRTSQALGQALGRPVLKEKTALLQLKS